MKLHEILLLSRYVVKSIFYSVPNGMKIWLRRDISNFLFLLKSTHIDRGSLEIQDYKHILSHLLLEEYDTDHFLNMGCSGNSGQQLEEPHGNLRYCYFFL